MQFCSSEIGKRLSLAGLSHIQRRVSCVKASTEIVAFKNDKSFSNDQSCRSDVIADQRPETILGLRFVSPASGRGDARHHGEPGFGCRSADRRWQIDLFSGPRRSDVGLGGRRITAHFVDERSGGRSD